MRVIALSLALASGPHGSDESSRPIDVTSQFEVAPELRVTLWAESPSFFNPAAIDVDAAGRVWVAEAVNYRKFRNAPDQRHWHDEGDRIMVLEDTDGDGRCDREVVFAQGPELIAPLGIAVLGDRVYVSCSPAILVYHDADGDLRADSHTVLLDGFGGIDHDHGVHSLVPGPDGRFYLACGNAGPHLVTDADGWTLRSGSFYGGATGHRSDDGRAWVGGLLLRVDADGGGLTPLAHNFRNCYEVALDSFGNLFVSDNDDDGNASCRTLWAMDGADTGYTSRDGARRWSEDQRPNQSRQDAHWHQDDPGVVPAGCINGAGGPTGVCVYESRALPGLYGAVLNCDAGRNVVYAHQPRVDGGGIALEPGTLIRSNADGGDKARWFRPSDVVVAPDGTIFVADWWDPGVGGHAAGDLDAAGRLLRIVPREDTTLATTPMDPTSPASCLAALDSPALATRHQARTALADGGEAFHDALRHKVFRSEAPPALRARALWALPSAPGLPVAQKIISSDAGPMAVAAFRWLRAHGATPDELATVALGHPNAGVRRELALALRDVPYDTCRPWILALAQRLHADRWSLEAWGLACDGKEEAVYPDLVLTFGDEPLRWSDAMARLVWRLHPHAAVTALEARAGSFSLSGEARRQALDTLAFIPTERAADAMARIYREGPDDTRSAAQWWLTHHAENAWSEWDVFSKAGLGTPRPATPTWQSETLTVESPAQTVTIPLEGADRLWLVVDDADDGYSHDWAAWGEPWLVSGDERTPLTSHDWTRAETGWGAVHVDGNARGDPLRVGTRELSFGVGVHAHSEVEFALPAGAYDALEVTVGPDAGGTSQAGARSSMRFAVYSARPASRTDLRPLRRTLLSTETAKSERRTLAKTLALDPEGGLLLLELAATEELPDDVRDVVTKHIHDNPHLTVRTLASAQFPRRDADGAVYPSLESLTTMEGDAIRGRSLFFGDAASCSTCHRHGDEGESLGPDLTGIHGKLDPAGLFDAMLNPNASILMGYESWMIETEQGLLLTGLLVADGETVILKEADGTRHVLKSSDIAFRRKLTTSTMPPIETLNLAPQQLADLVAFLSLDAHPPTDR